MKTGLGEEAPRGVLEDPRGEQEAEFRNLLQMVPEYIWRGVGLQPYKYRTLNEEMRLSEEEMSWNWAQVSQLSANLLQRENCIRLAHVTLDHPHSTWAL